MFEFEVSKFFKFRSPDSYRDGMTDLKNENNEELSEANSRIHLKNNIFMSKSDIMDKL